mgnify:CR=1 FL=1
MGLALIVLEAALDLKLVKEKAGLIFKSLSTAVLGLFATSYVGALVVNYAFSMPMIEALLFTVPLSILSSAIILPSLGSLDDYIFSKFSVGSFPTGRIDDGDYDCKSNDAGDDGD